MPKRISSSSEQAQQHQRYRRRKAKAQAKTQALQGAEARRLEVLIAHHDVDRAGVYVDSATVSETSLTDRPRR